MFPGVSQTEIGFGAFATTALVIIKLKVYSASQKLPVTVLKIFIGIGV